MKKLQSIMAFLCLEYPHKLELTKARLTKMVYLADWFSALLYDKQLTDIKWIFNHYGPYVDDVFDAAHSALGFKVENYGTVYGTSKHVILYQGSIDDLDLEKREKEILDAVIKKTKTMLFNDFVSYVYSTYPVKTKERYSTLDLVSLATKYKKENANKAGHSVA